MAKLEITAPGYFHQEDTTASRDWFQLVVVIISWCIIQER